MAVADGVNVGYEVFIIDTKVSSQGGILWKGEYIEHRERLSRKKRMELQDEDEEYSSKQLDNDIVNPNQIRTIIRAFKEHLPEMFPDRFNNVGTGRDPSPNNSEYVPVGTGRDLSLQNGDLSLQNGDLSQQTSVNKIKPLSELIGAYKTTVSKQIHLTGFIEFKWQRSFYEHIIRDEESLVKISDYIFNNPENWEQDKLFNS
jgi:hypothetical protein